MLALINLLVEIAREAQFYIYLLLVQPLMRQVPSCERTSHWCVLEGRAVLLHQYHSTRQLSLGVAYATFSMTLYRRSEEAAGNLSLNSRAIIRAYMACSLR